MRTIHRDIVSALLLSKDGKLLQGRKDSSKGGVYADCWHIPGGGIDAGEEKVYALIREVREETGIDVSAYPIELVDDQGGGMGEKTLKDTGETVLCEMKFFVYRVVLGDQNAEDVGVSLNDDLVEYAWTDLAELNRLKLTPPSVELFKRLGYLPGPVS